MRNWQISSAIPHFCERWYPPVSHAEITPLVFGVPLSQVISNDRALKQRHDPQWEGHSDPTELMLSFLHLTSSFKKANREFSSSNSSLSSSEAPNESPLISTADTAPRTRRRVGALTRASTKMRNHSDNTHTCDFLLICSVFFKGGGMFPQWANRACLYHSLFSLAGRSIGGLHHRPWR